MKSSVIFNAEANDDQGMVGRAETALWLPLIIAIFTQPPMLALWGEVDTAGIVLEVRGDLHAGDDGMPVQQDVLEILLRVRVPRVECPS